MDGLIAYAMLDKKLKSVVSGYDHAAQTGDTTFSIFFTDGSKVDLNIPKPLDGKDGKDGEQGERGLGIADAYFNTDDKLVIVLENGAELEPLTLPLAKVEVSKEAGNIMEQKADGVYVPKTDLTNYVEKETGKSLVSDTDITQIGTNKTAIETLNGADTVTGSVAKQIKDAVGDITQFDFKVVASLPTTGEKGIIYLVPKAETTAPDIHDEYIWVGDKFELIGNTKVDLSDYVKKDGDKVLSTNDYTDEDKAEVGKVKDKLDIQQSVEDKGKALVVGEDGKLTLEEVVTSDIGSIEANMLAWNVPSDCLVKNEVSGSNFIQKIARVNLGECDCKYTSVGLFKITVPVKSRGALYSDGYTSTIKAYSALADKEMTSFYDSLTTDVCVLIKDSEYTSAEAFMTALDGKYLYYELATPIVKQIDGNEVIEQINERVDDVYINGYASTNLLPYPYVGENALSGTRVEGGLTYTDNGDGSITIDGTSTGTSYIRLNVNGGIFGDISGSMVSDRGQLEIGEYTAIVAETKDNRLIVAYDPSRDLLAITSNGSGQVFNNEKFYPRVVKTNANDKSYNAYSKSNVDLTLEISHKELELAELKMLGWNVPKELPITNEVSDNKFIQKVGRVDLGSLDWGLSTEDKCIFRNSLIEIDNIKPYENIYTIPNAYIYGYIPFGYGPLSADDDLHFAISNIADNRLVVIDHEYNSVSSFKSAMKGKYLYYELAMPITIQIDGNELLNDYGTLTNYTEGFYITENKKLVANSDYFFTDFIPVNDTDSYTLVCKHTQDNSCLLCYDAGKNAIGVYSAFDRTITKFVAGACYIRVSFRKDMIAQSTVRDKNGNDIYKACKFNLDEFRKLKESIPASINIDNVTEDGDYNISELVEADVVNVICVTGFGNTNYFDFCIVNASPSQFTIRILSGSGTCRVTYQKYIK